MRLWKKELDKSTEKRFEQYMDSGGARDLANIILKKNAAMGLLLSAIFSIGFYQKGTIPLIGPFSILSVTQFTVGMTAFLTVIMTVLDLVTSTVTYLILSRRSEIEFRTVIAASVIGLNLTRRMSESHLLVNKEVQLEKSRIGKAFLLGKLIPILGPIMALWPIVIYFH